jgi:hypothetical protein
MPPGTNIWTRLRILCHYNQLPHDLHSWCSLHRHDRRWQQSQIPFTGPSSGSYQPIQLRRPEAHNGQFRITHKTPLMTAKQHSCPKYRVPLLSSLELLFVLSIPFRGGMPGFSVLAALYLTVGKCPCLQTWESSIAMIQSLGPCPHHEKGTCVLRRWSPSV